MQSRHLPVPRPRGDRDSHGMSTRGESLKSIAAFVLLACACGAAVQAEAPAPARGTNTVPMASASNAAPTVGPESFDDLAARAASLAPGMREVARKVGGASEPVDLARADARDTCVRVTFQSSTAIVAKLVDETGTVLATTAQPATDGALGEKGPVCIRKGDTVRGVIDGAGAHVRWMAWQSP
jgi:hypothetical protein